MNPIEKVLEAVDGYEERDNGFWCLCPAHDDHDPSLHVEEGEDGRALMVCRAGCSQAGVLAALEERGLSRRDLFDVDSGGSVVPLRNGSSKDPGRSPSYDRGRLVAIHERWESPSGKRFLWRNPSGEYSKRGEVRPAALPLYGSELVADWPKDRGIVLVEGEKAADALRGAGLRPALGTVTGASGTHDAGALEVLSGRRVILWPDNDAPGRTHMHRHAERLRGVASALHWYGWEGAPEKGDAADHPAVMSGDRAGLGELASKLKAAPAYDPEDTASGDSSPNGTEGSGSREDEGEERKPTQAELLVRCASGADLFHTPAGDCYATVPLRGHRETHPVKAKGFRRWLVRAYFERYDRPPGNQALQDALGLLEARAEFDGPEREIYVRVAERGGNVYVDLADEGWQVAEITAAGWRIVSGEAAPVRFRRPRGMLALPTPVPSPGCEDGCTDHLRRFLNVSSDEDLRLIVAWLVAALRPTGPYPVLLLQGEQGSAKSTAERLVRALVDPSAAPLRTTPRREHDLFIAADNAHIIALDNISTLQPWLSDALCRLSTGGGFSTRTLYENREEELFDGMKPVILNGITDVATRPDLLDRALVVSLPPIPEEGRRSEAELWREFDRALPAILASLFDAVSGALRSVEGVRLEGMPRMADFAMWATAAEGALGCRGQPDSQHPAAGAGGRAPDARAGRVRGTPGRAGGHAGGRGEEDERLREVDTGIRSVG